MSIPSQASSDPAADASLSVTMVSAADIVIGGTREVRGADTPIVATDEASAEPFEYQHVSLPTVGTIHVRYTQVEPLRPRRFQLDDDPQ